MRFVKYQFKLTIMISIHWLVENESMYFFVSKGVLLYLYLRPLRVRWPSFRKVYRTEQTGSRAFLPSSLSLWPLGRTRNEFATIAQNDCPVIYSRAYIAPSVSHAFARTSRAYPLQKYYGRTARSRPMFKNQSVWLSPFPTSLCRSNSFLSFLLYYFLDWCNRAEVITRRSLRPDRGPIIDPIIDIFPMLRAGGKARRRVFVVYDSFRGKRNESPFECSTLASEPGAVFRRSRIEWKRDRIARREINNTCQPDYDTVIRWK